MILIISFLFHFFQLQLVSPTRYSRIQAADARALEIAAFQRLQYLEIQHAAADNRARWQQNMPSPSPVIVSAVLSPTPHQHQV